MKPVELTIRQWDAIANQLLKEHPRSVLLIKWKMKEVLGFTRRTEGRNHNTIYLDFFDEKKQSFFLLKFSEYINNGFNQRY
jgi:hypothetical protein